LGREDVYAAATTAAGDRNPYLGANQDDDELPPF
jgi:hypothetical protein